ncbi:hypothetical protein TMatcc_003987 [Talaromyces marneffei ATCC 18224]|uniref:Uncharacterized protein n=1 Tax=Talaromyces marneffei (strain ATCC 18224 / CBS 334.59 / QM 7333) TaxID=441960 RepID=B6Q7G5_TALMQ|nr:hypothetical protein PMAA_025680 [Talaromyces marneffei ATCC 18224]
MEYNASEVRTRLDSLLETVIDDKETQKALSPDVDIPSQFLETHGITLEFHEFDNTSNSASKNIDLDPPILFDYCSPNFFQQHPVDLDAFTDPKWMKPTLHYAKFKKDMPLMSRVSYAAHYLHRWAGGGGLPRKGVLPGALSTCELRGLVSVTGRHALYTGLGFNNNVAHQYNVWIFEYDSVDKRFGSNKPHLILLGEIRDVGHEGSILYGELALLLTAMRNRAFQRAVFKYPDSDEDSEKGNEIPSDKGFRFEDERRFPVLMVSIVGMQHARISHACMDGLKVVIRQVGH